MRVPEHAALVIMNELWNAESLESDNAKCFQSFVNCEFASKPFLVSMNLEYLVAGRLP